MVWFIFILILLIIIGICIKKKLIIRFDTFFRKGFAKIEDRYGVYCWVGKQGDGKTYSLVDWLTEIKKGTNKKVITNVYSYHINNKDTTLYIPNFYDIINYINKMTESGQDKDFIIFYDELFTLLEKGKLDKSILSFISQLRKRGIYLVTTVQEWLDINVTFRRYCRYYIVCNMFNLPLFRCAFSVNVIHSRL